MMKISKLQRLKEIINDNNKTKLIYKFLYAIGLIFILFFIFQNRAQFVESLSKINIGFLLIPIILYPIGMIPTATAWHFLLKLIDQDRIILKDIYLYNLSIFSRHIPGYIWFLGSRSLVYKKENISNKNSIFLTILETILLSITGFVLSLPLIWTNRNLFPDNVIILITAFCILMIVLIITISLERTRLMIKRLSPKILTEEYIIPSIKNKNLLFSMINMFIGWIGGGILLLFVIQSFIPIQLDTVLLACGIWGFSGAVSLSLGIVIQGFGIREITIALLLSVILTPFQAASASIIFRLIITIGEILWVNVISLIYKYFYKRKKITEN